MSPFIPRIDIFMSKELNSNCCHVNRRNGNGNKTNLRLALDHLWACYYSGKPQFYDSFKNVIVSS